MRVWKVLNINANDRLLGYILNYNIEQKGRIVKEIILIKDNGRYQQYKIIYTE